MAQPSPIYQGLDESFQIDNCRPQLEAVESGRIKLNALTSGHYIGKLIPDDCLPGIPSIGYWDAFGPQDWGLEIHRNEGIEIVFLESGAMPFTVEESEFDLQPDTLTITRPWQLHRLGNPDIGPGRVYWVIFDVGVRRPNQPWNWPDWVVLKPEDLAELTNILRQNEQPVWPNSNSFRDCFRQLGKAIQSDQQGDSASTIRVHLNVLLLSLLKHFRKQPVTRDRDLTSSLRTVQLFLQDLERRPEQLSLSWTLESMSEHCGMGKSMFSTYCRKLTNLPPAEYLNRCRVQYAAQLLQNNPDVAITEIAFRSGFNSSQYFATVFRKHFRCSPRAYRRQFFSRIS